MEARGEVQEGCAELAIAIVPAHTDTTWWHRDVAEKAGAFMIRGRLSFNGITPAPFPSTLVMWGANSQHVDLVRWVLATAWHVAAKEPGS